MLSTVTPPPINVEHGIDKIGGLIALLLGLVILVIAVKTAWSKHSQGDVSGSFSSLGVVAVAVTIGALGAGAGLALAYGSSILKALTGLWA